MPNNPSVVHLAGTETPTLDPGHPKVLAVRLSPEGLRRMRARVNKATAVPNGIPRIVAAGRGSNAEFFEDTETFSILHLCNHWTAQVISAAGAPITPVVDTLPAGLGWDLKIRAHARVVK